MSADITILVVDDDENVRIILEMILQSRGYRTVLLPNDTKIEENLRTNQIDLILLDLYIGSVDGIEVLKRIKSIPEFFLTPIIMLTAEVNHDILETCLDSGASDFINKPVIPKILLSRIRSALSIRNYIKEIEKQKTELQDSENRLKLIFNAMKRELEKAKYTQETLVPPKFVNYRNYNLYSYYKPIDEIGGDFIGYRLTRNKELDILFGDVSGHGISSAMVSCMAILCFKSLMETISVDTASEGLRFLHDLLMDYVKKHYIVAAYLRIEPNSETLFYSYAGHHPMLVIKPDSVTELEGRGTPIILFPEVQAEEYEYKLEKDDKIFLFSDGLFEIFNDENQYLGNENFIKYVEQNRHLKGEEFLTKVSEFCLSFCKGVTRDDITMVLLEVD